ncbi:MAG: bL9 family ribosomal protein [Bacteroidales bacterium]
MKIILRQDIEKLGQKNDILTVKTGYARNYLIPRGFGSKNDSPRLGSQ